MQWWQPYGEMYIPIYAAKHLWSAHKNDGERWKEMGKKMISVTADSSLPESEEGGGKEIEMKRKGGMLQIMICIRIFIQTL